MMQASHQPCERFASKCRNPCTRCLNGPACAPTPLSSALNIPVLLSIAARRFKSTQLLHSLAPSLGHATRKSHCFPRLNMARIPFTQCKGREQSWSLRAHPPTLASEPLIGGWSKSPTPHINNAT
eukprot:3257413-Pleurochrysis_carterae.AAC.6